MRFKSFPNGVFMMVMDHCHQNSKLEDKVVFFFSNKPFHVGMELKKHGNKVDIKTQKTINLIQENGREERQKEYLASVPLIPSSVCNRCRILFESLFYIIFLN